MNEVVKWLVLVGALGGLLGGCGSSSSGGGSSVGFVQVVNGIEDSPALSIEITDDDDTVVESINTLNFAGASQRSSLSRGSYEIEVSFEDPATGFDERLLTQEFDITSDTTFTVVLAGTFADARIVLLERPDSDATEVDSDQIEVVAVNLSSASYDVHLGQDEDGTTADNLVGTLTAGTNTAPVVFTYDEDADYHVRLVADGANSLVYDSGEVPVAESSRLMVVVTDSTGADTTRPAAFVVRDTGATASANLLAEASFLVVNGVGDAASVDARVTVAATGDDLLNVSLGFSESSTSATSGENFVDIVATTATDPSVSYQATVSLNEDTAYSLTVAGGSVDEDVSIRANERDLRRVANGVNLHFVNTLRETDDEDSSEVDFYALTLGESLSDTAPVATAVEFLEGVSAVVGATPYDLVVTTTGTQSILAGPARIFPDGGERLIVISSEAAGGGEPYQVQVVADD